MKEVNYRDVAPIVLEKLAEGGVFLTVKDRKGRVNTMNIGWGSVAHYWNMPVFVAPVRHNRYTYELLQDADSFTVSVPLDDGMKSALAFVGTHHGNEVDKWAGAHIAPGRAHLRQVFRIAHRFRLLIAIRALIERAEARCRHARGIIIARRAAIVSITAHLPAAVRSALRICAAGIIEPARISRRAVHARRARRFIARTALRNFLLRRARAGSIALRRIRVLPAIVVGLVFLAIGIARIAIVHQTDKIQKFIYALATLASH